MAGWHAKEEKLACGNVPHFKEKRKEKMQLLSWERKRKNEGVGYYILEGLKFIYSIPY